MKKNYPLILIFILLAGVWLSACDSGITSEQASTSTAVPTSVVPLKPEYEVRRGDVVQILEFRARVVPVLEEELFFKETGYVHRVFFNRGDHVEAGQVIAELEGLEDFLRQLKLQELQIERAEIHLENAQLSLDVFKATQYFLSPNMDLELQKMENAVRLAEISLEEAKLQAEDLTAVVNKLQIIAPFDGVLLSLTVREGRQISAFDPLVVIGDVSSYELSAELPSANIADLAVDMEVEIKLSLRPDEIITGYIRQLPYTSTGGGVVGDESIYISVDSSNTELEIGELAAVHVEIDLHEGVLWLPPQAIRYFGGRSFVVVQDGENQRSIDVSLGLEGEGTIEILELEDQENLQEGQIVIGP